MASKHVPMQCEWDPAEGSIGQGIRPSHSVKSKNSQSAELSFLSTQRVFTTSISYLPPRKYTDSFFSPALGKGRTLNTGKGERWSREEEGGVLCENSLWE